MENLKLILIGPLSPSKLNIIKRISRLDLTDAIDLVRDNSVYTREFSVIYRCSPDFKELDVAEVSSRSHNNEELLAYLKGLLREEEPMVKLFRAINNIDFINSTDYVVLEIPIIEGIIPENNLFKAVDIIENRGFLDGEILEEGILKNTYRVHGLLISLSSYLENVKKFKETIDNSVLKPSSSVFEFIRYDKLQGKRELFRYKIEFQLVKEIIENIHKYSSGYYLMG